MMLEAARVAAVLTQLYGLSLRGQSESHDNGLLVRVSPTDVVQTQGFAIEVLVGWRSVTAEFVPGNFAAGLVQEMQKSSAQQRMAFAAFAEATRRDGGILEFAVNGSTLDPAVPDSWPDVWRTISIRLTRSPLVVDHSNGEGLEALVVVWGSRMLGLSLSLLPLEHHVLGEEEGGGVRVEVDRYERSSINRAACIAVHGVICNVCDFDFGEFYGVIGTGFIEVHHIEPVSGLLPGTLVDPARDLVPLCANCHAMIHRRTPPLTVEELRSILAVSAARRIET